MLFIDDLIIGGLKGFFFKGTQYSKLISARKSAVLNLENSLFIWMGLFKGSLLQIISRFSWEILQTVLGFFIAHLANIFRNVEAVKFADGATVLLGGGWRGSVSFGTYIMLYPGNHAGAPHMLFMHEYGHTLQSRLSGPLYLFKYGIPSILTGNYSWMEKDANLRAARYFNTHNKISFAEWQRSRFSKMAMEEINPKWWEYLLLLLGIGIFIIPVLNYKKGR